MTKDDPADRIRVKVGMDVRDVRTGITVSIRVDTPLPGAQRGPVPERVAGVEPGFKRDQVSPGDAAGLRAAQAAGKLSPLFGIVNGNFASAGKIPADGAETNRADPCGPARLHSVGKWSTSVRPACGSR